MWRTTDLVLRCVYLMLVPVALVPLAMMFSLTGSLIGAGIATVIALFGSERWHARVDRLPVIGRMLGSMGRLGDFYREHPPKPLVYYLAYPVLLPVILVLRTPRREFLLYRKLNIVALIAIAGIAALDYVRHWYPDIPFRIFGGTVFGSLVLQLLATVVLIMPIVTTIIALHQRSRDKTLAVIVVVAALLGTVSYVGMHRGHQVTNSVRMRIAARRLLSDRADAVCVAEHGGDRAACPSKIDAVMRAGLDAAWNALALHLDRAAALDAARAQLETIYKPDEAAAFDVWSGDGIVILYAAYDRHVVQWRGRREYGPIAAAEIPASARIEMIR